MRLLVIRHGQCLGQCEPYDPSPDSVLSELGEQQARLTALRLVQTMWVTTDRERDEQYEGHIVSSSPSIHILSSPLVRALRTASIIAEALGEPPVKVWTELRELYTPKYQGLKRKELQRRFPHAVLPASITNEGWEHGDTSLEAITLRCQHVIQTLKERFASDAQVIIVTHGGFANALLQTLLQISPTTPCWFAMDNCGISRVRLVADQEQVGWPPLYPAVGTEIACVNDVSHLLALG